MDSDVLAWSSVGKGERKRFIKIEKVGDRGQLEPAVTQDLAPGYACYVILARYMEFSRASVRWGRQFHAPNTIRPPPFPFPFSRSGVPFPATRLRQPTSGSIRLQSAECRHCRFPFPHLAFAFSTSSSLFRRVRPWSRHRTSTPVLAKHPPSRLFSCPTRPSAGVSPTECLWSVPRVRIIGGPEPAHAHAGAWCQMVTLPPTPDAATELPAQAGLVAAAAAAAVSPGPAAEGTPHPPRHPSRSMARLRLGYTKSRTGCLRCKQRRVKVAPVTPPRPHVSDLGGRTVR